MKIVLDKGYILLEEKTELIRNMLDEGIDYDTISKVTGKTIEEIKEIENSIEE